MMLSGHRINKLDFVLEPPRSAPHLGTAPGRISRRYNTALLTIQSLCLLFSAISALLITAPQSPAMAADTQTNRILIEYLPPTNPAHQPLFELLKERRVLEKVQEIFSPFRLPMDLTVKLEGCNGVSNAWYQRSSLTLCYEYMQEIRDSMPKETTEAGIAPIDAVVGQFFYVVAHEMGHAMFAYLQIPVFGRAEDAADSFSAYIMLQFGKQEARRLIKGAAFSYKKYMQAPKVTVPLMAFSDVHGAPVQRLYNLLCLAYGADPVLFADVVQNGYLPKERADNCRYEYNATRFAFHTLIFPHLDEQLAKQVMDKSWLPDLTAKN